MNKGLLVMIIFCFLSSCIGFKKNVNKGSKESYEDFFIGSNSFQYFIKPIRLNADKAYIEFDCTFKIIEDTPSDVTINYSIVDNLCRDLSSPEITFKSILGDEFVLVPKELFFREKQKKYCLVRQSATVNFSDFKRIFLNLFIIENSGNSFYLKNREKEKKNDVIEELLESIKL